MCNSVLIDYQLIGWARANDSRIRKDYPTIHRVGETPDVNASSSDSVLASFCIKHGCDLMTCDARAHVPMLEERGAESVRISTYDVNKSSGQRIYVVKPTLS